MTDAPKCDDPNCPKCGDPVPVDQRMKRGRQTWHDLCFGTYQTHLRTLKDPKRKAWWGSLSEEQQHAWYKKQRRIKESGGRVKYESHEIVEVEETAAVSSNQLIWDMVPWIEYLKEQFLLKKTEPEATDRWNADLMDEDIPKEKAGDVQLVGIFRGKRRADGLEERSGVSIKRQRTLAPGQKPEQELSSAKSEIAATAATREQALAPTEAAIPENQVPAEMISPTKSTPIKGHLLDDVEKDLAEKKKQEAIAHAADAEDQLAIDTYLAESAEGKVTVNNLTEFRTFLVSICTTRVLRIKNQLRVSETQCEELINTMSAASENTEVDAETEQWAGLKLNLLAARDAAQASVKKVIGEVSIDAMAGIHVVDGLVAFKTEAKEKEGQLGNAKKGGKLGEFKQVLRVVSKCCEVQRKADDEKALKASSGIGDDIDVALSQAMNSFGDIINAKPAVGVGYRLADAESGRAAKGTPKKQIATQTATSPLWQGQAKWVESKMEKEGRKTCVAELLGAPGPKQKLSSQIKMAFDMTFKSLDLGGEEWATNVFALQSWHTAANAVHAGSPPWAMQQGLLLVSGAEMIAGIPWEKYLGMASRRSGPTSLGSASTGL